MPPQGPNCPICLSPPTDPFSTPCSHIFCYECITTHLQTRPTCPLCPAYLTAEQLTPALPPPTTPPPQTRTPDITAATSSRRAAPPPLPRRSPHATESPRAGAHRRARAHLRAQAALEWGERGVGERLSGGDRYEQYGDVGKVPGVSASPDALLAVGERLSAEELANVIARLKGQLERKAGTERKVETELLLEFLRATKRDRVRKLEVLKEELRGLEADVEAAEVERARLCPEMSSTSSTVDGREKRGREEVSGEALRKRRRLVRNVDVLQGHYLNSVAPLRGEERKRALRRFTEDIFKLTQFARWRDRATLMHVARVPEAAGGGDVFRASNIVSSIEFDRESEFVATAGVTRRIKIFEFANITRNLAEVHYPVREIPTTAKLSWVCWNPYIRHHLVSSDYEGFVTLWDVNRGSALHEYEEHENRAWSVDYCPAKPTLFASGSDDGRVKLWTTNQRSSVLTIDNKPANVCSVKFHPSQAEKLAFGSVDFNVHYYDLRNPREALQVFKSHSRAVSYVKFMSDSQLVSASVDSTVKLWDLDKMALARTFTGHVNDKNFVGLSVTSDYIACGSEENTVYGYYKAIPRPFTAYRFSSVDPLTGEETQDDDESQFVSSVCWCPNQPNMLVAANSLGALKVLELDTSEGPDADSSG